MNGTVRLDVADGVATVVFDRPQSHNAMTFAMYEQLGAAIGRVGADPSVRAVVLRGSGNAFVAGTDIAEFTALHSAEDGVVYEARIEVAIAAIEALPMPTLAVVEGAAMGGGLIIAGGCDLRLVTPSARFGAPIARTVGNCLSARNTARLVAAFGASRARRILLLAETVDAETAAACGFALPVVARDALEARLAELLGTLKAHAPITMRVAKEAMRRHLSPPDPLDDDLVRLAYGSDDFREGVAAFLAKRPPKWIGG